VAIGLAVVLVLLIGLLLLARHKSSSRSSSTTTTSPSSSTSTSTSTTAAPTTTTTAPSTTTTVAPTTTAAAAPTGNRPATASERQQILADVGDSHPGYQVTTLRIANSDNTWAALKYDGGPTQQPFEEVRHLSSGHWTAVATGTAQVACDPSIPPSVQRDFADILGSC
jgi:cytoskeletal protein RodZ